MEVIYSLLGFIGIVPNQEAHSDMGFCPTMLLQNVYFNLKKEFLIFIFMLE